jgi:ankyrin repeat protein
VNPQGLAGWTALHKAAHGGHLEAVQMLLEHNADVNLRNILGEFPIHRAASPCDYRGHPDIMQQLLDHGADPNARDNDNSTPLHYSSWYRRLGHQDRHGTVEGTRLLLKYGAIVDAEDNMGRTPLQLALEHGRDDIVACLKEHGATR